MHVRTFGTVALATLAIATALADEPREVTVRWHGHACFELVFPGGLVVLTDPFGPSVGPYAFPSGVKPDLVTVSHEHGDHSNDAAVMGKPRVLRGVTSSDKEKQDWSAHDLTLQGVRVRSVGLYHDAKGGAERGKNAAFVFEPVTPGAFPAVVHLGDLGHDLTDEQAKAIGPVGVVLVPVGGHYTIDAAAAARVAKKLLGEKGHVVPMHYKTAGVKPTSPLVTADAFLELWKEPTRVAGNARALSFATGLEVTVLGFAAPAPAGTVKLSGARAWVTGPESRLYYTLTVTVEASPAGGTLVLSGQRGEAKLAFADFEDDSGAKQPELGWKLGANEKRTLQLLAPEGGLPTAAAVEITATLTTPGADPVSDTVKPVVQEVR